MSRSRPEPRCPIRVGDPCTLCVPGATGPHDCGLVYLVQSDPELREQLAARRRPAATRHVPAGPPAWGVPA
ncbi:MAG TPA: DUF6767 domain-containing protein [Intrasporangium sp.]|uniref:DUF6767 domain-containing protein n=1 Tax=Intrasporangium sp. TaxID=1925024 RepID=UPI002D779F1C|nr:DUF6767 domain-containing protein [Intrasporangium sp.]HET7398302.1 DUF6767 domain-containing protein [Intrasporangium sp.]